MQRPETIRAIDPVVDLNRQMKMVQNAIVPAMEMSRQMKAVQSMVATDITRQMKITRDVIGPALETDTPFPLSFPQPGSILWAGEVSRLSYGN